MIACNLYTLLVVGLLTAAPVEVEVQTLDGQILSGPVVEWTAERVTIQTGDKRVALEMADLLQIVPKKPSAAPDQQPVVRIELVDGSSLLGSDYVAQDGRARLTTPLGALEIPAADVASVRLQAESEAVAEDWARIVGANTDSDLLVIRKEDSIDYHRGIIRDVTDKVVEFELDGDVLPVKRDKVYGLVYHQRSGRSLPEAACWVTEAAGSQWTVRSIVLEGESLKWTTPTGLTVTRPPATVTKIDFSRGKIIYLSDLKPESTAWTPYFGMGKELPARASFYAPRQDQGLEPDGLRLEGKQYRKGLALHSRTKVVYRLPGRFRRFKAIAGIDDRVRPRGNVQLVISGDDQVLLEAALTGKDPPRELDLDLTGARRLTILVDFGEDLDVADHLDLCEARIVK